MRIYVFSARKAAKYMIILLAAICLIVAAGLFRPESVQVFAGSRELPIYSVETGDKKVSITFDCAWGAEDIPDILNTLEKADVKATFFIVGEWAEKFPDVVKMIGDKGHDIANHSLSHLKMGSLGEEKVKTEIALCSSKLEQISGHKVELFRPPFGDYSNTVIRTAKSLGCYTIQWDVDSLDWKPGISQDEIMNRITRKIRPGSIILFHNDTPHTAKMLPKVINTLKEQGYSIVPASQLIHKENYKIDNTGRQKKLQ